LEPRDYPILFQESDSCASRTEKRHYLLVRSKIAILFCIAGVASFSWSQEPNVRTTAAVISAILLVSAVVLTAVMDTRRFDQTWFSSRAVAESVKTESWAFMMKIKPYDGIIHDSEAERLFFNRLKETLNRQKSIASELPSQDQEGSVITERMKLTRNSSLEDRRDYYVQNRIRDQKQWYSIRTKWNRTQELRWSTLAWILQGVALVAAIVLIGFREFIINPVGILTTATAGVLAWLGARDYRRLSQSYGLVYQDLGLLEGLAKEVSTEEKLEDIVLDTERTISREHSMWLASRVQQ
jgi:hypothetical protein